MTRDEFKCFVELLVCSDPWPVEGDNQQVLEKWANAEAKRHGFADWIEAYHKL